MTAGRSLIGGRRFARGHRRPPAPGMNKEERAFAAHLQEELLAGRLRWVSEHEPQRLRLAEKCFYTPDFVALAEDDVIDIYDVKGRKIIKEKDESGRVISERETYWAEEDAKLKVRLAAALAFPFYRFFIVWPLRDGTWAREVF